MHIDVKYMYLSFKFQIDCNINTELIQVNVFHTFVQSFLLFCIEHSVILMKERELN